MYLKKLFTKSLLVAAGLCAGANAAWAAVGDVTTNADIDFSNAITGTNPYTIEGTVGKMTWTQQWTMAPNITDGILRFGNFNGGKVELVNNNIGAKDVVTITFDMAFGKLGGKHVGFDFLDTDGTIILTQWFDAYNGDFDDANPLNLDWSKMYRGSNEVIQERCVYFTIKLDYAAKTITTSTKCYLSGTGKAATEGEFTASLSSTKPLGAFVLQGNINNTGRYSTFDNLKITTTEGDYSAATAEYKVNWVCGTEVIKTETRSGDVGAAVVLTSTDKANFEANEKRYIYQGDNAAESVIAADGTTEVNISFKEGVKYSYTITSSYDGSPLDWSATGSVWEDLNSVNVYYPRYQAVGTTLVGLAPVNNDLKTTFTIDQDGFTADLEYTSEGIDNLYLLSEAENLGTGLSTNATTYTDRVSNRAIIFGAKGTLLTLPAGKYIFTLGAIGGDNNTHKVAYTVNAGAEQIAGGTCTGNFLTLIKSSDFTLNGTTDITFTCSDPASGRGIDLIYVQKTGDVELPASTTATLGANGYTTFASAYDLDLSSLSGVTAYTATLNGVELSFTECTDKVVAGTGLLLKGEAGAEVTIPVAAADAAAVSGNALIGVTADTDMQSNAEGNYIFVMKKATAASDELTFLPLTTEKAVTVPAGKAYVEVAASAFDAAQGVRALRVVPIGATTGIGVMTGVKAGNGEVYNLQGQRVEATVKGLYIVNGKKIVVK